LLLAWTRLRVVVCKAEHCRAEISYNQIPAMRPTIYRCHVQPRLLVHAQPRCFHSAQPWLSGWKSRGRDAEIVPNAAREQIDHLNYRQSDHGTPIVDWLMETHQLASKLSEAAVEEIRRRERSMEGEDDVRNKLRKLRIAFANKGRQPWNVGKKHRPGAACPADFSVLRPAEIPAR
jgi:hypothetical protein